ncbi:hypothetical protein ACFLXQ_05670 [Chloroflexota bacterium]
MSHISDALENLFKEAVHCQFCFDNGWVSHSLINMAQPRWIGTQYYSSEPKILIILLNPGSGGDTRRANKRLLALLEGYKDGENTIDEIFQHQAQDIHNWGRGKFANFYLRGLNLSLQNIAFANIAWCASAGNSYPNPMLSECFNRHTSPLIQSLSPDIAILSGNNVHRYGEVIRRLSPNTQIIPTVHYAHRKGYSVERQELERVRKLISDYSVKN